MTPPPISADRVRSLLGTPDTAASKAPVGCAPGSRKQWFKPVLSDEVVAGIRRDREAGMKVLDVAAKYGVSGACVSLIHSGNRRRNRGT